MCNICLGVRILLAMCCWVCGALKCTTLQNRITSILLCWFSVTFVAFFFSVFLFLFFRTFCLHLQHPQHSDVSNFSEHSDSINHTDGGNLCYFWSTSTIWPTVPELQSLQSHKKGISVQWERHFKKLEARNFCYSRTKTLQSFINHNKTQNQPIIRTWKY